jgi:membrane-associated protein
MLGRHERRSRWAATYQHRSRWAATLSIATMAMPHVMDPMYWIGPNGLFASAVLPGILVIVFIETGLLFPVLPGDSLLFTGGLLAAGGTMNIWTLVILVPLVAIAGDQTAYFIGRQIGPALFSKEDSRFFKKRYITESHEFFERNGPFTIILARFVPIVRTFTPVIAGASKMRYPVFLGFDIIGGIAWGAGVTLLGYSLGNVSFVKNHLELMILLVVFLSILPAIISVGRGLLQRRRAPREPMPEQSG